jgi:hypothetical protein
VEKTGRKPVVLNDDQILELGTLSAVLNTVQLADYFGISHVTFKALRDRDEKVSFAYKNGKAKAIANIGNNLISQANDGNVSAQIFYLKTQAGWKESDGDSEKESNAYTINIVNPHE